MSAYEIEEEYHFGEALPFTIKKDGVPILAVVGWGTPDMGPTERDRIFAQLVVKALTEADQLSAIRDAVVAHDDRLNNGVGDEGPQSPTGDDYNTLFRFIIDGVHVPKPHVPVIKGDGFNPNGGGFAKIIVDGKEFTPQQIADAIKAFGRPDR